MRKYWILFLVLCGTLQAEEPSCYQIDNIYPYSESHFFKNQDPLLQMIKDHQVKTIIEVGCWYGESTIFMAHHLPEGGKVYAVDSWIGYPKEIYKETFDVYKRFLSNVIQAGETDKIVPLRGTSLTVNRKFSEYDVKADLIYIDGDHAYKAVYSDIQAWAKFLKDGGILCGNLYCKNKQSEEIKKAVNNYCKHHGKKAFFRGYFWWIE